MFFRSCLDLISKQFILPRPSIGVTSSWFSKSASPPSPPKRPNSPWTLYIIDHFQLVFKENPGAPRAELFKKLSEGYQKLDKTELEKYERLSVEARKKYQAELEIYKANLTADEMLAIAERKAAERKGISPTVYKKQLKALGMPKRPANGYILFSHDYAKKNFSEGGAIFKRGSEVSAAWAQLPQEEKSKWLELAAEESRQYREKFEEWETKMVAEGNLEIVQTKPKRK